MIRVVTNSARAAQLPRRLCVVCDEELRRGSPLDRCAWHPVTKHLCACGEPIYYKNVSRLCRTCLILHNKLPVVRRAEFVRQVRNGDDLPDRVAGAIMDEVEAAKRRIAADLAALAAETARQTSVGIATLVINGVADRLDLTAADIMKRCRALHLVRARAAIAMVMIGRGYSRSKIGKLMGGRDHTVVINLEEKFDRYCATDPRLPDVVSEVAALAEVKAAERLSVANGGCDEPV